MSETYSTKQLYSLFNCSHQTIKNWTKDFSDWLSPTAQPDAGRKRVFTESDVCVFELVHRLKGEGKFNDDIKASLGAGERGEMPMMPVALSAPQHTALAIAMQQVSDLTEMLESAKHREAELNVKVDVLEKMLYKAQKRVVQLELRLDYGEDD